MRPIHEPVIRAGRSVQALWLAAFLLLVATAAAGLYYGYRQPELISVPEFVELIERLGIGVSASITLGLVVPIVASVTLGIVVFLGRRDDGMALLFALALLGMFVFFSGAPFALGKALPSLAPVARAAEILGLGTFIAVAYAFPSGRFVPPWTKWLPASMLTVLIVVPGLTEAIRLVISGARPATWRVIVVLLFSVVWIVTVVPSQVIRYRRVSSPVEQLQTRSIVFAFGLLTALALVTLAGLALSEAVPGWIGWVLLVAAVLGLVLPLAVAVAIFRYRLYDLDLVINRTVVYSIVVGLLAVLYAGAVFLLRGVLPGQSSDLAVAASTLAVAALFNPLRKRVQGFVDRRFYRSRYDAQEVADRFAARLRDQVDLDMVTSDLVDVVGRTVQPSMVSVWMRESGERP